MGALVLAGCAAPEVRVEYVPVEVRVPVPVACVPELPPVPEWETKRLKVEDDIDVKVKALLVERSQHLAYEEQLIASVEGCK